MKTYFWSFIYCGHNDDGADDIWVRFAVCDGTGNHRLRHVRPILWWRFMKSMVSRADVQFHRCAA